MGLRYRRRLKILPGLWFNLSKSGVSTSIGGHGATLNVGRNGTRTTLGLPGSGLSYRGRLAPYAAGGTNVGWLVVLAVVVAIIAASILSAS
jgi:uncharacterized protein DUF4236